MKKRLMLLFFVFLPKAFFSRIFGRFAQTKLSVMLLMEWFISNFKINMQEAEIPEEGFANMDQFFTRRLKQGVHKIDNSKLSVVSPVDARIDQFGDIVGTRILHVKGVDYYLSEILPSALHHKFIDGKFITLYLSPADYHRIHSPVSGNIFGMLYVPGKLFPVMELLVNGIRGVFCKNERMITYIQTKFGKCAVIKVGAMNVGKISVSYSNIISNKKFFRKKTEILYKDEIQPVINKGDELGIFHLGSTIVLLFEQDMVDFEKFNIGQRIRMGQKFANLKVKNN